MGNNENEKEEDLDQAFLDDVLNKLYDFGDGPASKRKNKAQKKKKRKRCEEEEDTHADEDCCGSDDGQPQGSSGANHQDSSETERIGSANQAQPPGVEVVTFQDPMKRPRTKKWTLVTPVVLPESNKKAQIKDKQQPDSAVLEKARLEVHRFGLTGYKKEQQRVFEQERAIMLGARPPKKEFVNYKVYQQMIKDKKMKAREEAEADPNKKKKKKKPRDEKPKSSSGGSAPTGQVGRFKHGMLVLNPMDIKRIGIKTRVSKK